MEVETRDEEAHEVAVGPGVVDVVGGVVVRFADQVEILFAALLLLGLDESVFYGPRVQVRVGPRAVDIVAGVVEGTGDVVVREVRDGHDGIVRGILDGLGSVAYGLGGAGERVGHGVTRFESVLARELDELLPARTGRDDAVIEEVLPQLRV